nr:hypothetical protein CFP56_00100 [Quercus suber]
MAGDLRRWDDDCVDELCDIVFGQWMLGNFAAGLPREPLWDVIIDTLNARTGKDFHKRQGVACSSLICETSDYARFRCSLPPRTSSGEQVLPMVRGNPIVPPCSGNNGASTSTANYRHVMEMLKASKRRMAHKRDDITDAMWADYVGCRN